jgi:hypothetical protein
VFTPNEIQNQLEMILPTVQKPGRYTGGELNQVVKDWQEIRTKVAMIFPDIYDLGMSNLGMAILYDQVNQRPDALAERAYAPWSDMEQAMRRSRPNIPWQISISSVFHCHMRLCIPIPLTFSTWRAYRSSQPSAATSTL